MFVRQMFDKSLRYVDHAIPEKDVANPVWDVSVNPRSSECAYVKGSAGSTILVKENGRERFSLGEPNNEMSAKALLLCGQALLRAGNEPAKIPLVQFVNDVSNRPNLTQSVEVDPHRVSIVTNPFTSGYKMIVVDERFPALNVPSRLVGDAYQALEKAREEGRMVSLNFKHGVTETGVKLSAPALTASAEPTVTGSVGGDSSSSR